MQAILSGRKLFLFLIFIEGSLLFFIPIAFAATSGTSSLSQTINSGSLTISVSSGTTTLPSIAVSGASQVTVGTLSQVNVYDQRGTAAGWTSSMTLQHLTITKDPRAASGNTSPLVTLNSGSRYDGSCGIKLPHASYTVTISSGGPVGTATYSVTGGCSGESNQTDVTTAASNNSVGSRGVKIDFPAGNYVAADSWLIAVDVYPYTKTNVVPQDPTAAISGSDLTNVTTAAAATLSGTSLQSDSKAILSASSGYGMGSYNQDVTLRQTVHTYSYSGSFSGTLTVTVS